MLCILTVYTHHMHTTKRDKRQAETDSHKENCIFTSKFIILSLPVTVYERIESQTIRPAIGEIKNIDLWIVLS